MFFPPNRLLVAKIHFKTGSLLNCLMCRHSTGLYICAFLGISGPLPVQLLFQMAQSSTETTFMWSQICGSSKSSNELSIITGDSFTANNLLHAVVCTSMGPTQPLLTTPSYSIHVHPRPQTKFKWKCCHHCDTLNNILFTSQFHKQTESGVLLK